MKTVDLSEVDPLRHAEILRRIGIIESYLAIDQSTSIETAKHASDIGLSLPSFYRVAKSWRLHRNPAVLPGAGSWGAKRTWRNGVSAEAKAIVANVIAQLGVSASQAAIHKAVCERCEVAAIAAPSRGAVWTYVMDARAAPDHPLAGEPRLVVGRCWAQLPTDVEGTLTLPEISIAIVLPERLVLGIDLSFDQHAPASAALSLGQALDALGTLARHLPIEMDIGDTATAHTVLHARQEGERVKPVATTSPTVIAALGRDLGGTKLIHRRRCASMTRLLGSTKNSAIGPSTAIVAIFNAVARHNDRLRSRCGNKIGTGGLDPSSGAQLA